MPLSPLAMAMSLEEEDEPRERSFPRIRYPTGQMVSPSKSNRMIL
jgi:hypothetical protein